MSLTHRKGQKILLVYGISLVFYIYIALITTGVLIVMPRVEPHAKFNLLLHTNNVVDTYSNPWHSDHIYNSAKARSGYALYMVPKVNHYYYKRIFIHIYYKMLKCFVTDVCIYNN